MVANSLAAKKIQHLSLAEMSLLKVMNNAKQNSELGQDGCDPVPNL